MRGDGFILCYRDIGEDDYRIRVQATSEDPAARFSFLVDCLGRLDGKGQKWWGHHVKDGDHLSMVIQDKGKGLASALNMLDI